MSLCCFYNKNSLNYFKYIIIEVKLNIKIIKKFPITTFPNEQVLSFKL